MNGWSGSQPPASGGVVALVPAKAGAAMRAALIAPTAAIRPSLTAGGFAVVCRSPVPTSRYDENRRPVARDRSRGNRALIAFYRHDTAIAQRDQRLARSGASERLVSRRVGVGVVLDFKVAAPAQSVESTRAADDRP